MGEGGSRIGVPLVDVHRTAIVADKPLIAEHSGLAPGELHHFARQRAEAFELSRLHRQFDVSRDLLFRLRHLFARAAACGRHLLLLHRDRISIFILSVLPAENHI